MKKAVFVVLAVAACSSNPPRNRVPTIERQEITTDEDTTVSVAIEAADPDGDPVTITYANPAHGTVSMSGLMLTYTPATDYHGSDAIVVTVSDGTLSVSATMAVVVASVNDLPVAVDDSLAANEDAISSIAASALLSNDTDLDGDTLTVTAVGAATHGTVALAGDTITFTPDANFNGTASFEYTLSDGTVSDGGVVTLEVGGQNDAPVATNDALTTAEDTVATVTSAVLVANDTDLDANTLSVTAVGNASNGAVDLSGNTVTFTPTANFSGTGGFDYTVSDGVATATGHVVVTITPVNDPPVAVAASVTTNEDVPVTITLTGADTEASSLTFSIVTSPTRGTLGAITPLTPTSASVTYTPNVNSSLDDAFTFRVNDGTADGAPATVTIDVVPVNDAPVAVDDSATVNRNVALVRPASVYLANDIDIDETTGLTITSVLNVVSGTVSLAGGFVTFTPDADFVGAASFDYEVSDSQGLTDIGHVDLTVAFLNDLPVAVDDSLTVDEDAAATLVDVLANDSDAEGPLTVTSVFGVSHGVVTLASGQVRYQPEADYHGADSFSYTVEDTDGATATATVLVTVTSVNDAPVAQAQNVNASEDTPVTITLTGSDDDAAPLTFAISTPPGHGTLGAVTPTTMTSATVVYTPTAGYDGPDSFGFTAGDESLTSAVAMVSINVAAGPGCGDSIVVAPEACDDGNQIETDGCTTLCQAGPLCAATNPLLAAADHFATDPQTGHCYASFDDEATTFAAAQTACGAAGGYWTTITSATEQTRVRSIQNPSQNPWIGGTDTVVEGTFAWLTGEAFAFMSYEPGQPDSGGGVVEEDCLHLVSSAAPSGQAGGWNDAPCDDPGFVVGRICELEARTFFFSEYIEGATGTNKAVEIANPYLSPVSLIGCQAALYSNGASVPSQTVNLTQMIAPQDVFVVCNSASSATILNQCDLQSSTVMNFNGDDAVELVCNGATVDVVGQIGVDPGTEWGTAPTSTLNSTLRRRCSVTEGDSNGADAFDPAVEWVGTSGDVFTDLGTYTCAP